MMKIKKIKMDNKIKLKIVINILSLLEMDGNMINYKMILGNLEVIIILEEVVIVNLDGILNMNNNNKEE